MAVLHVKINLGNISLAFNPITANWTSVTARYFLLVKSLFVYAWLIVTDAVADMSANASHDRHLGMRPW